MSGLHAQSAHALGWSRRVNVMRNISGVIRVTPSQLELFLSRNKTLFRSLADRWAPLFVADSLVQDRPDQPTQSIGNDANGLIVAEPRDRAATHDFEKTPLLLTAPLAALLNKRRMSRLPFGER